MTLNCALRKESEMPAIETSMTLAEIINSYPSLARELDGWRLDYCCNGSQTLAQACTALGVDPEELAGELSRDSDSTVTSDWVGLNAADLVDHLEATHHLYLHKELPRLATLGEKVGNAHQVSFPELLEVVGTFDALKSDLQPHLMKEEKVLFPLIRQLVASDEHPDFQCGSIASPISVMTQEHRNAGWLLDRLVDLTGNFEPPSDGCASVQAFYEGLAQLNADTRLHVHKENNVLFPTVLRLERR